MTEAGHAIGVDIGGTFTDVVCRGPDDRLRVVKIPTTRANPSRGVLDAIALTGARWSVVPGDIARFVHGTTVATNAILERKHARIGLVTTAGFKDVLEIGRQKRSAVYDLVLNPETPVFLAPGERRKEVDERVASTGEIVRPLDEEGVLAAAEALLAEGVDAIAIAFLFSFVNPVHERRARTLIQAKYPGLMLSLSSEVDPAAREYERTCVTAFDAAVKPVLDRYLANLEGDLKGGGVAAPLQVMTSRGGIASAATARERPVRLLLSGPAAGVIGGQIVGAMAGIDNVISIDIGGTSCDIALVAKGQPLIRAEGLIGGYAIRVPMVDVNAIGSGGGSVAWLDSAGGLRVGPHSAGSEPGPACYGRGGSEPTVTDASVVLGYIGPERFAGGSLRLSPERAAEAIDRVVGRPLGLSTEAAALGIHRILNAQMAEGIRLVSIRRGYDPRDFALVAGGGGGPLHACPLARELAIERILVPPFPGALSACGLLAAPTEQELSIAFSRELSALGEDELRAALGELDARCGDVMRGEVANGQTVRVHHFADVCYVGQGYHLEVPLSLDGAGPAIERLYRDFLAAHDRVYGHSTRNPARIVNLRTVHRAGGAAGLGRAPEPKAAAGRAERRSILLPEPWGRVEAQVAQRDGMAIGVALDGPAIVEQADTTTLIEPGWRARALEGGVLLLERSG
ncbi:MAG: hydantoinase/oxoprolinase family protein [Alphaproteobacteria bacterium]